MMTQTILSGSSSRKTAGIILRCSAGIEEPDQTESSGDRKIYMEILFPAGAALPETGTAVLILPQSRKGIVLQCRVTDSNSAFCRVMAALRPCEES